MGCVFCGFASGKRKANKNRYPFIPIHKSKNIMSFLSIDFPAHEDGHTVIIPRKHFRYVEHIPKNILNELAGHAALISKMIRKSHKGCNILVNNGKCAGQYINHAHFHVIPRDPNDGIKIGRWKRKEISRKRFESLSKKFMEDLKETQR
ncbi:HIT family protein [Candidatus Woesearchaeota archaeon]|nr:HIT family protein [Candidatus Woesearchaeota archaeon]